MRVAIIGGGFVGLTAALRLVQQGCRVSVYDPASKVGGLASGFSQPGWEWPVERFYHHIFTNDWDIIRLANEVDWPPRFYRPTTSILSQGKIYPFDSPVQILRYPHLSFPEKIRMGSILSFLKLTPFWKPFERLSAEDFLQRSMGDRVYETIWKPLLIGKFGPFAREVNAAWFWARIHKRTPSLGYFREGFQGLANKLANLITENEGSFYLGRPVTSIRSSGAGLTLTSTRGNERYDRVLYTTNMESFLTLLSHSLPDSYCQRFLSLKFLDALVVLLVFSRPLMKNVYWLNVLDPEHPFLVVVEHTAMIDPSHYGGQHLVYLGSYLPADHALFRLPQTELVKLSLKQLGQTLGGFPRRSLVRSFVFRGRRAQPLIPSSYSRLLPSMETPIPHLYLANMSLIYPWDRGTNYAVALGERAASFILSRSL